MYDNIPLWLALPVIIVGGIVALYRCYILPGYLKDRAALATQNGTM